ncbi:hypothetical protein BDQ17DRAFT_1336373 [Cyathus striatus]|nr:hypothetical protein BDQ17DRAFT_1336373 [Cyathus striatus]
MTNLHWLNFPPNSGIQTPGPTQVPGNAAAANPQPERGTAANEEQGDRPVSREASSAPTETAEIQHEGHPVDAEDDATRIRALEAALNVAEARLANRPPLFNMTAEPD